MTEDLTNEDDFSVQDSTEEFELENDINNDYEAEDFDFGGSDDSADNQAEVSEPTEVNPEPAAEPMAEPTTASIQAEPEQKTSSSFRVMRYEDFLNKSGD